MIGTIICNCSCLVRGSHWLTSKGISSALGFAGTILFNTSWIVERLVDALQIM